MNHPSLGFQRDTEAREQEKRHSLDSPLNFLLFNGKSTDSRDVWDAARARLYRLLILLNRKTKVPIPPFSPSKPTPHGFCSRKLGTSFPADPTGTENSHTGTRSSPDQRVSMKK